MRFLRSKTARWAVPLVVVLVALVVLFVSPAERTLGQIVKIVYAHVALSQAGGIAIYLAGVIGLVVMVGGSDRLSAIMRAIGWAGLALYIAGFGISLIAQVSAWGGVAWQEPRVSAGLNLLAVAVIVQVLNGWLPWVQGRGGLRLLLAGFQLWSARQAENVLHPGSAIGSSESVIIQATGVILLVLALLLGAWVVWLLIPAQVPTTSHEEATDATA